MDTCLARKLLLVVSGLLSAGSVLTIIVWGLYALAQEKEWAIFWALVGLLVLGVLVITGAALLKAVCP